MLQQGGDKMEVIIHKQYKNIQNFIFNTLVVVIFTLFSYEVLGMGLYYAISLFIVAFLIVVGIYALFTYMDEKIGKNVIIIDNNMILWGRYLKDGGFVRVFGPIKFISMYQIKVKDRYVEIHYISLRNNLKTDIRIDLKALFMDENERRRRQKILEELLRRVKMVNPRVEIIDKRKKKFKT